MSTTSGTIGTTTLTVAQLLEHAFRRCGVQPGAITPESEIAARESLFMLMVSLASRGINLWCVEKNILGLNPSQAIYTLPAGTLNVLNWIHSTPTEAVGIDTFIGNSVFTELTGQTSIPRFGFQMSITTSGFVQFLGSNDGVNWTSITNVTTTGPWIGHQWYWYDLDPPPFYKHYQFLTDASITWVEHYLASSVRDIKISPWNRDDWANQPNKVKTGDPATNVYFEKLVNPRFTLWPVPVSNKNQVCVFRHRQIQDVGDLTNMLEIPLRWYEEIVWQLALRVASEVPGADARLPFVAQMAEQFKIEAESGETDGAPIYLTPNIRGYTA